MEDKNTICGVLLLGTGCGYCKVCFEYLSNLPYYNTATTYKRGEIIKSDLLRVLFSQKNSNIGNELDNARYWNIKPPGEPKQITKKIKIIKNKRVEEEIEVILPHYYKQDVSTDYGSNVIYGRICEDISCAIQISKVYGQKMDMTIELEVEKTDFTDQSGYFQPGYDSNKEEYEAAREKLNQLIASHA